MLWGARWSRKNRKLQFVYINGSNTWYQYDITNERLISFNRPELKVEIYADGDKVTDSSRYNVVWEMFDESVSSSGSSNNTNETCFSIVKINSNISQIRYKDPAIYWTDNTKIYTNIVRAIVTILDNSSLGSKTLYIYYTIDIICLQNNSYVSKVIPIINNGFDEVVYSKNGANPEYDKFKSFWMYK